MLDSAQVLEARLPAFAHKFIGGALAGDLEATRFLIVTAPNEMRPDVLVALHDQLGAGHPAVRAALKTVWCLDHGYLIRALGRRLAWRMLEANGSRPAGLPRTITLYRGGSGDASVIRRGWSWTTHLEVAVFFARRYGGPACVLEAVVPSSRIVHSCDSREEAELVLFGCRTAVPLHFA